MNTPAELENVFMEKWGDKRDDRYLPTSLSKINKNENKTME
jgi:hypothetical protein